MFLQLAAAFLLCVALATSALGATITVTITGVTGEVRVGEGPVFGHSSYQKIPLGTPFVLTYSFDDERGRESISSVSGDLITASKIENKEASSPGRNAVLQIGGSVWEFGPAAHAAVTMNTGATGRSAHFVFNTQAGGNRVSAEIVPAKGGYWPKNGDWRASFVATSLDGSTASFSADNDRVSAKGQLTPESIEVKGVDLDGQWLQALPSDGGKAWAWQLAHPSPAGGYIIEEVTRDLLGSMHEGSAITPVAVTYWQAWRVAPGARAPENAGDSFTMPTQAQGAGVDKVTAVARFYEGATLPSSFAAGKTSLRGPAPFFSHAASVSHGSCQLAGCPVGHSLLLEFFFRLLSCRRTYSSGGLPGHPS